MHITDGRCFSSLLTIITIFLQYFADPILIYTAQGSTQAQLEQALPGVSLEELALTLNAALKENRLTVLANAKDSFYKTVPLDEFEK